MKVRVMSRYTPGSVNPYYSVDTWRKLFWQIGYWETQIRTTDFNYAQSVFLEYKNNERGLRTKDKCILIHYE